jgi:outer membrane protein W
MKKRLLIMVVTFAAGFIFVPASAQDKLKIEIGYNISAPLGSLKSNYISNTSLRGLMGEISYAINPKFSIGLHSGYQSYYQKYGREQYKTGPNETTSAVVTNTMEVLPLIIRGTYFPKGGSSSIQPYVSAGAGVNMVNYSQYFGQFTDNQASIPVAAHAGAGILIPFGNKFNQSGFKLGATYNFSAYNKNNISNLSSVGAHASLVFALR